MRGERESVVPAMPILSLVTFVAIAVVWMAVLLTVLSEGLGRGPHIWIQVGVLLGFPLAAWPLWRRLRRARTSIGEAT